MSVLIVDDEPDIRDTLAELLHLEGIATACAGDGVEALERMRERVPSVVIVDVLMPRMDGVELFRAMQADPALAGVPVIFSTSDPTRVPPGSVVVPKPVKVAALLAMIAALQRSSPHAGQPPA